MRTLPALLLVPLLAAPIAPASPGPAPREKVAPWVLQKTEGGASAEFLVVLAEQADLSGAAALATKLEKGLFVRERLWSTAQESQEGLLSDLRRRGVPHRPYYVVNAVWVKGDRDLALALAARQEVARVEGNPVVRNVVEPSEEGPGLRSLAPLAVEPGITQTRAPEVWAAGYTGQGVVVGGQDTGVQWDHPALKAHYRGWSGGRADHNYSWHDAVHSGGGVCGANSAVPCDDTSHGTHTMGTVVGDDGAGNQIGMAPGAKWIACRNMDQGNGTPATYLECFEFFLAPYPVGGTPAQGDPAMAPDVTNNSWGCPPSEGCNATTLLAAVEAQRAAGILTVASAGNTGSGCSTVSDPPAIYAASLTVGALTTGTSSIASFSSRGPVTIDGSNRMKPDVAAPGTSTRSAVPTNGYGSKSGTSMAGPHVAGAAALLLSAKPALSGQPDAAANVLKQSAVAIVSTSCSSPGGDPNNVFGHGRLDVKAAVDLALHPSRLYTATPCRAVDTRLADGPLGGPALASGATRTFTLAGSCAIPATATCVAANVTATGSSGAGFLRAWAGGDPVPPTSVVNFAVGATRANSAVVCLGAGATLSLQAAVDGGGTAHAVVDVFGWFE